MFDWTPNSPPIGGTVNGRCRWTESPRNLLPQAGVQGSN